MGGAEGRRTVETFYWVTWNASHQRGSNSKGRGVETLASARACAPYMRVSHILETEPYFGDRGGALRRSAAPTQHRGNTVWSKLRHRNQQGDDHLEWSWRMWGTMWRIGDNNLNGIWVVTTILELRNYREFTGVVYCSEVEVPVRECQMEILQKGSIKQDIERE
jgi:hypothetical protein